MKNLPRKLQLFKNLKIHKFTKYGLISSYLFDLFTSFYGS